MMVKIQVDEAFALLCYHILNVWLLPCTKYIQLHHVLHVHTLVIENYCGFYGLDLEDMAATSVSHFSQTTP